MVITRGLTLLDNQLFTFFSTVVVLGFSQVDFTTSENVEGVEVRVEVMVGQLERSVAVWVNSTQQSTATPGQGASTMTLAIVCAHTVHYLYRL